MLTAESAILLHELGTFTQQVDRAFSVRADTLCASCLSGLSLNSRSEIEGWVWMSGELVFLRSHTFFVALRNCERNLGIMAGGVAPEAVIVSALVNEG